jgi:hypothetical protein
MSSPVGVATPTTLVVNGTPQTVIIPGGETFAKGATIYLIPNTLPVDVTTPTRSRSNPIGAVTRTTDLKPAEFYFQNTDGTTTDTGLQLSGHELVGSDNTPFAYFGLSYPDLGITRKVSLFVEGPLQLGSGSAILDISDRLQITFELSNGGDLGPGQFSTYPTYTQYILPADGTSTFNSLFLAAFAPLPQGVTVSASLTVSWPGESKSQSRLSNGGLVYLFDGSDSGTTDVVPGKGITRAEMAISK